MKRCPKCSRTFPDDNQKFCTIDGGLLVAGESFDPNATIQGSANLAVPTAPPPEQPVSNRPQDFGETIAGAAPTAVLPRNKQTGPTGAPTSANLPPTQPSAPLPPPPPQTAPPTPSAPLPQAPVPVAPVVAAAPPKKKSKLPLILGILVILFVLGAGAVAAAFFLVIKPQLDKRKAEGPIVVKPAEPENVNTNTNTNTNTEPTPAPEKTVAEFVAPPDTTKFVNSSAQLDGKLAEHYFDFSFYYPNAWEPDPKAGTSGASNFAKVERRLPPDFTQENFAVGWYTSKGTFAADEATFPQLVEVLGKSLAGNFPEYKKVSEGPTKINSMDAYEFRFTSISKGSEKGDIQVWGRVVFLPSGVEGSSNGATLVMLATSLAPELSGVADVGEKGQMPVILESFRFGH
jgi:hypothetical protein